MVDEIGLTNVDVNVIEEIMKKNNLPKDNLTHKQVLYLFHEYKKNRLKPAEPEKKSKYRVFSQFVKYCLQRNLANYDTLLLLSSDKGTGKSSTGIQLCRAWCKLIGIRFDPKKHIAYNNEDIMRLIQELPAFSPILCLSGDTSIKVKVEGIEKTESIKDLVGRNDYEVLSYNIKNDRYEYKKPEKTIQTGKEVVFEIELINGKKIKATENHLFLTKKGYKKLKDLTEDEEIQVRSKTCVICDKEFIPVREEVKVCCRKCGLKRYALEHKEKIKKYLHIYRKENSEELLKKKQKWAIENPDKYKEQKHKEYQKNKDKYKISNKKYYDNNKEAIKETRKKWLKNNYTKHRKYLNNKHKELMKTNPEYKIKRNLRRRVSLALNDQGMIKDISLKDFLGCTIPEFKEYINKLFTEGMNWKNYGEWHIDHIKPCSSFNLTKKEEQIKCFNYNNLQPLWAIDNLKKGDKNVY